MMKFFKNMKSERGSIVTVMIGGVALLAAISFGAYQFMAGPLSATARVTQNNSVKNQTAMINRALMTDAPLQSWGEDCDADGFVEPRGFRSASGAAPTNGGWLPTEIGVPTIDPWGMEYGYCAWDVGPNFAVEASKAYSLSAMQYSSCALKADKTLWCWGTESTGELGDGGGETDSTTTPAQSDSSIWTYLGRAYNSHICGIKSDDSAWCWGNGTQGELGNGASVNEAAPVAVSGGASWSKVETGTLFSCGLKTDGTAWCWGRAANGVLGNGQFTGTYNTPQAVSGGGTWKDISVGNAHVCGLKSDDEIYCWGHAGFGRLGNGTNTGNQNTPGIITESGPWQSVSTGSLTACGIKTDGTAWCWGGAQNGSLGDGVGGDHEEPDPIQINDAGPWKFIEAGSNVGCGIKTDNTGWCWGANANYRLGDGTNSDALSPTEIDGSYLWSYIDTATTHTCGIQTDNTVWCWGRELDGKIGNGSTTGTQASPLQVTGFSAAAGEGCGQNMLDGPDAPTCPDPISGMTPSSSMSPNTTGTYLTPNQDPATLAMTVTLPDPLADGLIVESGNTGRGLAIWIEDETLYFSVGEGSVTDNTLGNVTINTTLTGMDGQTIDIVAAVDNNPGMAALYINDCFRAKGEIPNGGPLAGSKWTSLEDAGYGIRGSTIRVGPDDVPDFNTTNGSLDSNLIIYGDQTPPNFPNKPVSDNIETQNLLAIISAGPDRTFQTSCTDYVDTATNTITRGGDDIIASMNYNEASLAAGDLWTLKDGDPDTAEIDKDLEVGSDISFNTTNGLIRTSIFATTGKINASGGIEIGDEQNSPLCTAAEEGLLRYNSAGGNLDICKGAAGWQNVSGGASWPMLAPDGTSSAPSYSFSNATGSGLYLADPIISLHAASNYSNLVGGGSFLQLGATDSYFESNGSVFELYARGDNFATVGYQGATDEFRMITAGGLQIGNITATCTGDLQGTLRYNSSTKDYEFCDSEGWTTFERVQVTYDDCQDDGTSKCTLDVSRSLSDPDFTADNILKDVNILGVTGTAVDASLGRWRRGKNQIAAGPNIACAIGSEGAAFCWGDDADGSIGDGDPASAVNVPTNIAEAGYWTSIDTQNYGSHACATKDGTAWCWGKDDKGQLGNGTTTTADQTAPVLVNNTSGLDFVEITTGATHSCGLMSDGTVWCWGEGVHGELGIGSNSDTDEMSSAISGYSFRKISSGLYYTCGITDDGVTYCWGDNGAGRSGNNAPGSKNTPGVVLGGHTFIDISAGHMVTCALDTDRSYWCWGSNQYGTYGDGGSTPTSNNTPVQGNDLGPWKEISVGIEHVCGIKMDGTAWCWGRNNSGQLGNGLQGTSLVQRTPQQVSDTGPWISINAGMSNTCAVKANGSLWCWGHRQYGTIGDNGGTTYGTYATTPTLVTTPDYVTSGQRIVFATASSWSGGSIDEPAGAHAKCQAAAETAGLPGRYMAWIATNDFAPAYGFEQSTVAYVLPDGTKVADNWDDLIDGTLDNYILQDENGNDLTGINPKYAWTNVTTSGAAHTDTSSFGACNRFTSDSFNFGRATIDGSGTDWTTPGSSVICGTAARLYCFQQPSSADTEVDIENAYRVFATAGVHQGVNIGGGSGAANTACQAAADAASLDGRFVAWYTGLSDASPSITFDRSQAFKLLNDTVLAVDWYDLTDGTLEAEINIDENGSAVNLASNPYVWTNTDEDGTIHISSPAARCTNATDTSNRSTIDNTTSGWTDPNVSSVCTLEGHLYCFEQPDLAYPGGTSTEKIVFVQSGGSIGMYSGSATNFDGFCQSKAGAIGLSGTYKAWVSDSSSSPSTRFAQSSVPYVLLDGTKIADNWADLTDGTLDAAINIDHNGSTYSGAVQTGTSTSGANTGNNCNNWGGNTMVDLGSSSATDSTWTNGFFDFGSMCTDAIPFYCFEQ